MTSSTIENAPAFRNEPFSEFSDPQVATKMRLAIDEVRAQIPVRFRLGDYNQEQTSESQIISVNPTRPDEVIAVHAAATVAQVPMAIQQAQKAFPCWSARPPQERIALLKKAASLLRERKMLFSAWMVLEAGKNWVEADADTAEAIDFLEYYARQAEHLANTSPDIQLPGEIDRLVYIPFGVGAVLPPWNFPLAILAGMVCSAIVMGNTVVLKPSPYTPTIAAQFVALLTECGLPPGV